MTPCAGTPLPRALSVQELFQIPAREQIGRAKSVPAEEYADGLQPDPVPIWSSRSLTLPPKEGMTNDP